MKHTFDMPPVTVELRRRIENGRTITWHRYGERDVVCTLTIDLAKLRHLAHRAAANKSGKSIVQGGAIVVKVETKGLPRITNPEYAP